MNRSHPINLALLVLLDNQEARTAAALEGLKEEVFDVPPGGDCHTIRQVAQHLLELRKFQLTLLNSTLAAKVAEPSAVTSLATAEKQLEEAAKLVRQAIQAHNPEDWFAVPAKPREGPWGGEATLSRVMRPINDFTNHLGSIRAVRRILGNPTARTQ